MSYYFGINSVNASSFFNSFGSRNSLGINSMYSNLADYSSIRTGSYSRLLKHYYAQTTPITTPKTEKRSKTQEEENKAQKTTATVATTMKNNADTLEETSFTEDNRSKVTSNINNFVDSYNKLLTDTKSSANRTVAQKYKSMTSLTKSYTKSLASVGITVQSDNTLSINSDTLKKTDMTKLSSLFSGNYSYSSQISNYAGMVYSANSIGTSQAYTSNGTMNTLSSGTILDTYV